MSSTLFRFQQALVNLFSRRKVSDQPILVAPLEPGLPVTEPITKEDEELTQFYLFNKLGYQRVTYSRHYRREYDIRGNLVNEEFLPKFDDETIVDILKKLRSGIFGIISDIGQFTVELSEDPSNWGTLAPYIWYNILLGPYIYGKSIQGRYNTSQDQFDPYDENDDVPAQAAILPPIDNYEFARMTYMNGLIVCIFKGPPESFAVIKYKDPPEETIVDYLRQQRKLWDTPTTAFELLVFHNLLVPYVFGKR